MRKRINRAFTLAEVLITLGIIGVVASMTIPTLMHNIKEEQFKKAFTEDYSILSSAIASLKYDNGGDIAGAFTDSKALIEAFSTKIKMVKKCDQTFVNCWLPRDKYSFFGNEQYFWSSNQSGAILINGAAITNEFLTPDCDDNWFGHSEKFDICATITIDVNGTSPPNVFGRDLYSVWLTKNGLRPYGVDDNFTCKRVSGNYAGQGCAADVIMNINY